MTTDVTNQIMLVDSGVIQWATIYDPFGNPYRKVWGYYVTAPGGQVKRPPNDDKSFLSLVQDRMIGDHYVSLAESPRSLI